VTPPLRLVIAGCRGRMGSLLVEEALKDPARFTLAAAVEQEGHPHLGQPVAGGSALRITADFPAALTNADLVVEFTQPEATTAHARAAARAKIPMVLGTTGFSAAQMETLQECARQIPLFWSPNMSVGIVIVRRTIAAISKQLFEFGLGEQTRVAISETHHARKLDKPSGTAKALAQELLKATGWLIKEEEIEARREGDVVGLHSVTFRCPAENITVTHEATDRRVFAQGALLVARNFRRLFTQPGWYSMDHFVSTIQKGRAR
jgi:4-hydroxy-tetrahydrodipicolinate reductase